MARPKTEIDWEEVDGYLQAGCTGTGIAGLLGIHPDTLYRTCEADHKIGFAAYSQQKRAEGDDLLRATQFQTATSGNIPMLIWLGKNRLGQSDKMETVVTNKPTDLTKLTEDELRQLEKLTDKIGDKGGDLQT